VSVVAERLPGGQALTAILFTLNLAQQFTQTLAGLAQLRLRNTHRTPQYSGNFAVFISFYIVQDKYCALANGQLLDAAFEVYPVNRSLERHVRRPNIDAWPSGFTVWDGNRFDRDD
jgi:hypothetical protein